MIFPHYLLPPPFVLKMIFRSLTILISLLHFLLCLLHMLLLHIRNQQDYKMLKSVKYDKIRDNFLRKELTPNLVREHQVGIQESRESTGKDVIICQNSIVIQKDVFALSLQWWPTEITCDTNMRFALVPTKSVNDFCNLRLI